jgi:hypothetical protein
MPSAIRCIFDETRTSFDNKRTPLQERISSILTEPVGFCNNNNNDFADSVTYTPMVKSGSKQAVEGKTKKARKAKFQIN